MNQKIKRIFLIFLFLGLFSSLFFSVRADPSYGVGHNSEYVWNVKETLANETIQYRLTARFNLKHNNVTITKYYYSNGTSMQYNLAMNQFRKNLLPLNDINGEHNYFYTGPGSLDLPRNVYILEDEGVTQIIEYETGVTLQYTSSNLEQELIDGSIPISMVVWIILGGTIGLTTITLIFIYSKSKKQYQTIVYPINEI